MLNQSEDVDELGLVSIGSAESRRVYVRARDRSSLQPCYLWGWSVLPLWKFFGMRLDFSVLQCIKCCGDIGEKFSRGRMSADKVVRGHVRQMMDHHKRGSLLSPTALIMARCGSVNGEVNQDPKRVDVTRCHRCSSISSQLP